MKQGYVLGDNLRERVDLSAHSPFSLMRLCLPYGKWTLEDSTEIFFNRHYQAIWAKKGGEYLSANPLAWTQWKKQEWFYDDCNPPWRSKKTYEKCLTLLRERHEIEKCHH